MDDFTYPAGFATLLNNNDIQCHLCPHYCIIPLGKTGVCGVRYNKSGQFINLVHSRAVATAVEPIEKKPLYHFLPGHLTYSLASVGCNLRCQFCQNWEISQMPQQKRGLAGKWLPPEAVVKQAITNHCHSICFTYTEPIVYAEYVVDVARLAKQKNLKVILVTGGYITQEGLEFLTPWIDALKLDLKGPDEAFYRHIVRGQLAPVQKALAKFYQAGVWVEVSTVLLPQQNDSEIAIRQMAEIIISTTNHRTPWHITRFFPSYELQYQHPSNIEKLQQAYTIARACGLKYVYLSNVPNLSQANTNCEVCGQQLLKRTAGRLEQNKLRGKMCPTCNHIWHGIATLREEKQYATST